VIRWVELGIALIGSIIGVVSALQALIAVGNQPPYSDRMALGILALVMAADVTILPLAMRSRPRIAALVMVTSGIGGALAINLFYINTYYLLALPLPAGAALLAGGGLRHRRRLPGEARATRSIKLKQWSITACLYIYHVALITPSCHNHLLIVTAIKSDSYSQSSRRTMR
jgi:hypothetical protein